MLRQLFGNYLGRDVFKNPNYIISSLEEENDRIMTVLSNKTFLVQSITNYTHTVTVSQQPAQLTI